MPDIDPNRLFSRHEVEKIYGLSVRFLEIAASNRNGPVIVRYGRMVRYRARDIEDWILRHRDTNQGAQGDGRQSLPVAA